MPSLETRAALLSLLFACGCGEQVGNKDGSGANGGSTGGNRQDWGGAAGSGASNGASDGAGGNSGKKDLSDLQGVGPTQVELTCEQDAAVAESPLLKLSTTQYRNTVLDLARRLGLDSLISGLTPLLAKVPADSLGDSFRALDGRIAIEHVQGFFDVGVFVGDAIASSEDLLESVAGSCASESNLDDDCWNDFLDGALKLIHRRPLLQAERNLYGKLDDGSRSAAELVGASLIVALSSPRFLYQPELEGDSVADRDDLLELDGYAIASRLSYTFWQTMPDAELFAAAESGELLSKEGYQEQLQRVWEDPRTEATLEQFWNEWLKLEKFTGFETKRPGFIALTEGSAFAEHDYYGDMVREVLDLTQYFTFEQPSTLSDLLTTRLSLTQSEELAALYGIEAWDGEGAPPAYEDRAGLLQRGALLVSNLETTNPFHRGAIVRRAILCDELPQPDPNQLPPGSLDPPPLDEEQTTRERFQAKIAGNRECTGCHGLFSDLGYVMEAYDAVGRFRSVEKVFDEKSGELLAELPLDTTAQVWISESKEDSVSGPVELNQAIVGSGKVEACLAQSYFSYAVRRAQASDSLDACVIRDLSEQLSDQDAGLAAAFQRVAQMPTFFVRKVGAQ